MKECGQKIYVPIVYAPNVFQVSTSFETISKTLGMQSGKSHKPTERESVTFSPLTIFALF